MLIHSRQWRAAGVSLALILLVASQAAADTVRVLVDRALIWSRPGGVSVVLTQVARGTELTVLRQVDDWYEVILPGARGRVGAPTGFIRVAQAVVWILEPNGPMTAARASTTARRPRSANFVNVDVGYRLGGDDLVHTASAFSDLYAEAGSITSNYGDGSGLQVDVMAGGYLTPTFAVAFGFSFYPRMQDGHVDAEIPHPFYFNQLRAASIDSSEVTGNEFAFHISLLVTAWETPAQRLSLFGGPSFFRVTQQVPTTLTIDESYPYDEAAISGVTTTSAHASAVGFHVGSDYTRFFGKNIGVGVAVRYSRGSIDHTEAPAASGSGATTGSAHTTGTAGSAVASGGIRFRF